jgi:hypothetical protein
MIKDHSSPNLLSQKTLVFDKKRDRSARRNLTPSRHAEIVEKFELFQR